MIQCLVHTYFYSFPGLLVLHTFIKMFLKQRCTLRCLKAGVMGFISTRLNECILCSRTCKTSLSKHAQQQQGPFGKVVGIFNSCLQPFYKQSVLLCGYKEVLPQHSLTGTASRHYHTMVELNAEPKAVHDICHDISGNTLQYFLSCSMRL